MKKPQWQKLKKGDVIRFGNNGRDRKIVRVGVYNKKTNAVFLRQIGYSYLGRADGKRCVVYLSCDCNNFNLVKKAI